MFSIHILLQDGSPGTVRKQVPCVFVLMSRRRKKDYKKVLMEVCSLLGDSYIVKKVVLDFEQAMWGALQELFGNDVIRSGCLFHYSQAIFRKIVAIGQRKSFNNIKM